MLWSEMFDRKIKYKINEQYEPDVFDDIDNYTQDTEDLQELEALFEKFWR